MGGQQRELEVTVLSARDLKNVTLMGGAMNPYCVAWLYPHAKVSGPVNKGGGANPTWNAIVTLVAEESLLEQGDAAVTVEIYNHGKFSNKLIGTATVGIPGHGIPKDTTGSTGSASRAAAYQVRKKSGKHQGVINVAVKVGKVLSEEEAAARSTPPSMGIPAMGGGYLRQQQQQPYYPQQQQYGGQYSQGGYPQQQQYGGQYSQGGYPQQQQQQPRRGGLGGAGMGLGAGLLGGLFLGEALDGGGGGCGGGGCGGG